MAVDDSAKENVSWYLSDGFLGALASHSSTIRVAFVTVALICFIGGAAIAAMILFL